MDFETTDQLINKALDRVLHNSLRHKLLSMDTPPHFKDGFLIF